MMVLVMVHINGVTWSLVESTSHIDFHDGRRRVRCAQRCTDRQTRTHSYGALTVAGAHSCLCFSIAAEGGRSLSTCPLLVAWPACGFE
ncbi:hypothetical protein WUBG_00083 [Wuchereria bancrofti]|uniref:Uncharacterized protein n=1 Tax=Wuchereria bancrofti TaxID=6293 RepID=J9F3A9_WUCBA|nr:hypothetical protein WUBG_00083 [Wuchereria bancrofti]